MPFCIETKLVVAYTRPHSTGQAEAVQNNTWDGRHGTIHKASFACQLMLVVLHYTQEVAEFAYKKQPKL